MRGLAAPFSHLANNPARKEPVFFALILEPDLYWLIQLKQHTSEIVSVDFVADWEDLYLHGVVRAVPVWHTSKN